jgi:hypothetical protein
MTRIFFVLLIALCAISAASDSKPPADPDFSWASNCSPEVRTALDRARVNWQAAATVPPKDKKSPARRFDEAYLRELLTSPDRDAAIYSLLDTAVRRQKQLEDCRTEYLRAVTLARSTSPDTTSAFDPPYYLLRSRIKLATGLARAAISAQMTGQDTSNYCFEAMESAIDALRDAAADAAKVPGGAKRAESISKLRSILFDVWERAQRAKDTNLIGEIDLARAFDQSGVLDASRTQSRL